MRMDGMRMILCDCDCDCDGRLRGWARQGGKRVVMVVIGLAISIFLSVIENRL